MRSASKLFTLPALGLVCFAATAPAQEVQPATASADKFLAEMGDHWRVVNEPITGSPAFVYGDRIPVALTPRTDRGYEETARQVVNENFELFGFGADSLELRKVHHLNLSRVGSSDKVAAIFDQVVDGVPVWNGAVSVLFDAASGDVVALDTTGVPYAQNVALVPGSSTSQALAAAETAYAAQFGVSASSIDSVDVALIGPSAFFGWKSPLRDRGATLAYVIELSTPGIFTGEQLPAQGRVFVSAEGDLSVFKVEPTAHAIDGKVEGRANAGQEPNTPANQETLPLRNMWVRNGSAGGAILATTGANGTYNTGTTGPTNLFFELRGPFCDVDNDDPTNVDATVVLANATGSNQNVLFNPTMSEFPTAEVAGFYWVNAFREWVVSVDPSDTTMNFSVFTEVNKDDLTCNAYYDGNSINLERAESNCQNTAYSDVILHEEGHWANEVYNGGVTGAFHEGNADNFAYHINDEPCLNHFIGSGCLRTALQTSVKKCATDGDESCNGGASHTEGQALASAMWAVRTRLNTTHGAAIGDAISNALFLAWMNTFNDGAILNVIQDHYIALDDDNGNLSDGTPNFADITTGFQAYNWPAPPDLTISITNAPAANAEIAHLAPVSITANIASLQGTVTAATIHYAPEGQAFTTLPMTATGNPNQFSGTIPGVASPNRVRWYVGATSSAGGIDTSPKGAPTNTNVYIVGTVVLLQNFNFDAGNDQGWTHVALSGSNGDQWQRGSPINSNEVTDPPTAFSAPSVWGTDLSLTGFDGKYEPNGSGELRSPTFNFSGESKVYLQYRRWLAVESGNFDQADIRVNNTLVWQNPSSANLIDTAWVTHDLDITAQAAGNPSVQIRYRLTSDAGVEFGGWNIDDFRIYRVDPSPGGFFAQYGAGCPGTGGVTPSLSGSGVPISNGSITVSVANGRPNGAGLLLVGLTQASVNIGAGCTLLVGSTIGAGVPLTLNGAGAVSLPATLPGSLPTFDVFMQFFGADAGAANGVYSTSNGLQMHLP